MPIAGLGPHGERAVPHTLLRLTETEEMDLRARRSSVAVVLHTTTSDWARLQLAGIVATLGRYGAAVVDVVDCNFNIEQQIQAIQSIISDKPDAIISIPIGNTAVAEAHRCVHRAGIKLIFMDNSPTGLLPGQDYVTVVSADNFGLGQVSAKLLAAHIPPGGAVGVLSYGVDFFATNERHIAFCKWMEAERPDIIIKQAKFAKVSQAGKIAGELLDGNPDLSGLFVVWDEPAMLAVAALKARSLGLPVTTIDLGNEAVTEMVGGGLIKGIGAQQPYDQGTTVATATLISLVGRQPPSWVALPGLSVTPQNAVEAYQVVWHAPAPPVLIKARKLSSLGQSIQV
jgi:ribose transport system substrate-binding protein